ncbi:unnamed protein product [Sphenostylis stenocarpa]|uniref:Uncharacterized protein n=1 Tax=Sphenostylis stenocarpa TaxID=92480 RepID=A0AA86W0R5_9FABA|nr:unnamed protein product [Sphenostylis stenocarpa]
MEDEKKNVRNPKENPIENLAVYSVTSQMQCASNPKSDASPLHTLTTFSTHRNKERDTKLRIANAANPKGLDRSLLFLLKDSFHFHIPSSHGSYSIISSFLIVRSLMLFLLPMCISNT